MLICLRQSKISLFHYNQCTLIFALPLFKWQWFMRPRRKQQASGLTSTGLEIHHMCHYRKQKLKMPLVRTLILVDPGSFHGFQKNSFLTQRCLNISHNEYRKFISMETLFCTQLSCSLKRFLHDTKEGFHITGLLYICHGKVLYTKLTVTELQQPHSPLHLQYSSLP